MKLYNAMEESYLKENLIHKWVTNIVRQNDGYEFLLDDEVYLPVYKYALKIIMPIDHRFPGNQIKIRHMARHRKN